MPITDTQLKLITEEAERLYPVQMDCVTVDNQKIEYDYNEEIRDAYIAAATSEREKAKVLVDALEWAFKKDGYQYLADTLNTYNKTINNE